MLLSVFLLVISGSIFYETPSQLYHDIHSISYDNTSTCDITHVRNWILLDDAMMDCLSTGNMIYDDDITCQEISRYPLVDLDMLVNRTYKYQLIYKDHRIDISLGTGPEIIQEQACVDP